MQIKEVLREYYNVLKMSKKPSREEFTLTAKVALAVMFVVGFVGFAIYLLLEVLPGAFR
ncbi:MAG: protein translocase SEC61 complex subunit gamma [Archaeoglobi archaeon]|jgi:protein transport protein SEC61 subunit gamma-like protein|nr:protein translocase SEC61 complex subunit gamma [Archaeoglobus sp.]TDA28094.1 MAG: protein translocase SEC61 complex subunit gamma [Archaeoglobi archaeon]